MRAYVVRLKNAGERRENMAGELVSAGQDYEIVEAVDGRALTPAQRSELIDEAAATEFPDWFTPGMIGCALSHLAVFRRIVESGDEHAIVLEDDVVLRQGFASAAAEVAGELRGSEVALLYFRSFGPAKFSLQQARPIGTARLMYPLSLRGLVTSASYVITAEAAERLADTILPVRAAADSWDRFYDWGALDAVRCLVPPVTGVRTDFKSTIGSVSDASLRARATSLVVRRRWVPLMKLMALNRRLLERRMTRFTFVADPSPIGRPPS